MLMNKRSAGTDGPLPGPVGLSLRRTVGTVGTNVNSTILGHFPSPSSLWQLRPATAINRVEQNKKIKNETETETQNDKMVFGFSLLLAAFVFVLNFVPCAAAAAVPRWRT